MGRGRLALPLIVVLAGCRDGDATRRDAQQDDTTPPEVVSSEPPDGAVDVDVGQEIRVRFSELVDSKTVGILALQVFAGGTAVAGIIGVDRAEAIFVPLAPLAEGTQHTVIVAPSVTDLAGNRLRQPFQFRFTTRLGPFDYSLTPLPAALSAVQGGTAGIEIVASPTLGKPRFVTLSVAGCPPAASCVLLPSTVFEPGSLGLISLRVVTSATTPVGRHSLAVQGEPPSTKPVTIELSIEEPPAAGVPRRLWGEPGLGVCIEPHAQSAVVAATDGAGGAIVAWTDARGSDGFSPAVYAQRIDARGIPLWRPQGIPIAKATTLSGSPAGQGPPAIGPDGAGGAIVAWTDYRTGVSEVYAQRLDGSGNPLWEANGVVVSLPCAPAGCSFQEKVDVKVAPVAAGGAVIAWGETTVRAQRLDGSGRRLWRSESSPIASVPSSVTNVKVAAGPAGESILIWLDSRIGIGAQKIDPAGAASWRSDGVDVGAAPGSSSPYALAVASDGAGGGYVVWFDRSTTDPPDVRAQRIAFDGSLPWGARGVRVSTQDGDEGAVDVSSDGQGGALVAWEGRGTTGQWIFAQHLNAQGEAQWMNGGALVHDYHGFVPRIAPDGSGGALAVWEGFGPSGPSVGVQRLDPSGRALWGSSGFSAYTAPDGHYGMVAALVTSGVGRVTLLWNDYRIKNEYAVDVFAQSVADAQ